MKHFLSLIASVCIIAGAYLWSFGLPEILSFTTPNQEVAKEEAAAQRGPKPGGGRGGGATTVVLTPLLMQPYENIFHAVGSSQALQSATISPDVSGKVTKVNLAANSIVSKDEILVELDARIELLNLATSVSELEQANDTVSRYEQLQQTGNSTVSGVAISEARLAQSLAEAKVGLAQLALDDRTIRAPISGKIGLSDVNVGDTISANNVITTIDRSDSLIVEFELPERSISLLAVGREVLAGTPSFVGHVFTGEIISFDSRIDDITRSVTVKAKIENSDGVLWPGMTFTVRVTHLSEPLAMVPSTAITWSRNGSSIWFENAGKAVSAPVTILFRQNNHVWLDTDIPEGSMIVTEGAQKLRNGAAIIDANSQPGAPERPLTSNAGTHATSDSPSLIKEPT